ncbi:PREDICTED: biotin carboxyl carrier protein of acetyl-CoA carboxylase 2, chloroplastic [Camelina sativa]|uniref:Biotin carboxyl carrier protein of acetyl-CoA carboxylase n=1 Tax=Camelina sativa TaxID=90675 RepID=A0ABM0T367_CAMSA|nr:PREDICTED: biotin carboxyl carrier protein of acetyl-CoA carboxylase 2, chloroplastic [Camelina sativa]
MASLSVPCAPNRQVCSLPGISTRRWQQQPSGLSFPSGVSQTHSTIWRLRATTNEVVSNSSPLTNGGYLNGKAKTNVTEPAELSEFMAKVSGLLKLVDSRDIVELELKQLDCEIVIRKKEALQQAAPPAPVYHSMPPLMADLPMPPAQSVAPPPPTPASTSATAKPTTAPSPSQPPLKSPMAGTFYRSPGPGEPPFVKVGDKVQKGQVVCIIEAMKLMNEIEAEKSGTITELLAEDGKPVSVDTPLFVIVS